MKKEYAKFLHEITKEKVVPEIIKKSGYGVT